VVVLTEVKTFQHEKTPGQRYGGPGNRSPMYDLLIMNMCTHYSSSQQVPVLGGSRWHQVDLFFVIYCIDYLSISCIYIHSMPERASAPAQTIREFLGLQSATGA